MVEVVIKNPQGLHARPAAMFVQIASKYNANVALQKGEERVNGKSIMGILTLGIEQNSQVVLEADGDDADEVVAELTQLLTKESME
ncbi:MAG: HPr family phosphocarrier protein [Candidatus Omnitrophica bacterium]|nr:HPr family phosphocarrier protein [Candidatus Omnitrophota bacterium]MBI5023943.1 HPr family phosphocarrier protein [Candidatus Omnitrophota bacterium]